MTDALLHHCDPKMFAVPGRTLVGDGSSRDLGPGLAAMGCAPGPVAVIADQAILSLGLAEPVLESLRTAGFSPELADGIPGEPTLGIARAAVTAVRETKPVAVVGIGGGSALDMAKLAALVAPRDEDVEAYLGTRDDVERTLPLAAVPTTAGTGSETTRISMLSVESRKVIVSSAALVPDLVALDPELLLSLPGAVTAATGLDALCHAIEAMLSTNRSPLSIASSRQGLRLITDSLERSWDHPDDIAARRGTLYGAHFAGRGLNAGVVLGHSIGYTLANRAPLAHGISCAMALPFCLRYVRRAAEPVLLEIAHEVTGQPDLDGLIEWVQQLNSALEVPRGFEAVGIAIGAAPEMAAECLEEYPRPNNPEPLELGKLTAMYEAIADGDGGTSPIG